MALVSPIKLSDEEKLDVSQRLDRFRHWHFLDEKRHCLVCGKIITGREIQVIGGTRGNGLLRIICPTEHCNAMPMEWVRPTDEVLIKIAMVGRAPQAWPDQSSRPCNAISTEEKRQAIRSVERLGLADAPLETIVTDLGLSFDVQLNLSR